MNIYEAELSKRYLKEFIPAIKENYSTQWYHEFICDKIQELIFGDINRLMIFLPPQHGKSEISSRMTPSYYSGHFPDNNIALVSYNQTFCSKFNRSIQGIMECEKYKKVFETRLPEKWDTKVKNSTEIEINNGDGSIKTIGVGGALTGNAVDLLIIDDVYKSHEEAWSPVGRQSVQDWYATVAETRLHNDSKILIVFTRWHEEDLAGYLLKEEPDKWDVISIPAILEAEEQRTEADKREIGGALWENKHSIKTLNNIKKRNKTVFNSLYQQDPQPAEGLLYEPFNTHNKKDWGYMKCKIDVADKGDDYLSAIAFDDDTEYAYVKDIFYTQEGHNLSERALINFFKVNNIQEADFESNNAGNIYADNIEKECRLQGMNISIKKFNQSKNKESRILGAATIVNNRIYMPEGWETRHPTFYNHVSKFRRLFKANKHDDAPDTLTLVAETLISSNGGGFA